MTDEEIIRNHYIFSTTHELDDDDYRKDILKILESNKED